MTQEEKELLLKDLCGRLYYWPSIRTNEGDEGYIVGVENSREGLFIVYILEDGEGYDCVESIDDFKVYLRPMSSMTEEEKAIYSNYRRVVRGLGLMFEYNIDSTVEWLLQHHFDYRGLIEKGLALEAKEGMYETE